MSVDPPSKISVLVPVYGPGKHLNEIVARVDETFADSPTQIEYILVDDCGSDESWQVIVTLAAERTDVTGIRLMRNFGQHNALMCGFSFAKGDVIVTIDDDLQHDPTQIPMLINRLTETNADVVYGSYLSKKHALGRNIGSWVVNKLYRVIFRMPVTVSAFRAIRAEVVASILRYDLNFTYIDGLLAWCTQRIEMESIAHHPRQDGKSGYTLGKLVTLAMNVFTNFSLLPLQLVSALGVVASLCGISLALWYLFLALTNQLEVPGYASTIVAILILGGLQLFSLGITGEYIGRLHLNVNRKPQYVIRKLTGPEQDQSESKDNS